MFRSKIAASAAVFILVFTVSCLLVTKSTRQEADHTPLKYLWRKENISYTYSTAILNEINLHGLKISTVTDINADLNVRIFDTETSLKLGIAPDNISAINNGIKDIRLENLYKIPVIIELAQDGRFINTTYPVNTSEKQRQALKGFYGSLEMILRNEKNYTAEQTDATGKYIAEYSRKTNGYHKQKISYVSEVAGSNSYMQAEAEITSSEHSFVPAIDKSWLESASGKEEIILKNSAGEAVVKSSITTRLVSIDPKQGYFANLSYYDSIKKMREGIRIYSPKITASGKPANTRAKALFKSNLNGLGDRGQRNVSVNMRELLMRDKELIADIPDIIMSGELNKNQTMELIKILGIISIPEAQMALLSITDNNAQTDNNRLGAVIAFSSVNLPLIPQAKELLMNRLEAVQVSADSISLYASSILALGSISKNISDQYPLEAKEISDELSDNLNSATPIQQKYLLKSLGNTYDERYSPVIIEYAESGTEKVRKAAVESLKYMEDKESEYFLKDHFPNEESGDVRYAIINTLNSRNIDSDTYQKITSYAPSETNLDTRRGFIKMIDKRITDYPDSIHTLEGMLQNETSEVNIRKIIKAADKIRQK